ncbi:MAG: N(G),N(G)-dimethylarginine dimethylaminohydrolase [Thermoanaerobaculia bacterium]
MQFTRAIVRPPAPNFADGLTSAELGVPDVALALVQHEAYCEALERCGLALTRLPADDRFPDSTFVEDTAVLTPKSVVFTRPGAESRRGEVEGVRSAIRTLGRREREIMAPGTVDGGDICEAGSHVLIGISHRTNEDGGRQLAAFLAEDGFTSSFVDIRAVPSILHLKSGLSWLGENALHAAGWLLTIEALAMMPEVARFDQIRVPSKEEYGGNAVRVNGHVLLAEGLPHTAELVRAAGYDVITISMSEFRKMDGGLSCLSLRC